jgi:hypothetical protein
VKQVDGRGGASGREEKKLLSATGMGTFKRFEKSRVWGGKDGRMDTDCERECQQL